MEKNLKIKQKGNRVEFSYDLDGEPDEEVDIFFQLTIKGKIYKQEDLHLEGDLKKVKPGKGKKVYWNVVRDFKKGINDDHILAKLEAPRDKEYTDPVTGMKFIKVKGGCYEMGDTFGDG